MNNNLFLKIHNFLVKKSWRVLLINLTLSVFATIIFSNWLSDTSLTSDRIYREKMIRDFHLAFEQYVHPLEGIRFAFQMSNKTVTAEKFRDGSMSRDMFKRFKGALGFGFVRRVPIEQLENYLKNQKRHRPNFTLKRLSVISPIDDLFIIEAIEPMEVNAQALGLVISDEERRRNAAQVAMESGTAEISRPVKLVQKHQSGTGFLMLFPLYRSPVVPSTVPARKKDLVGWAYTPLLASDIVDFVLSQNPNIEISKVISISENEPSEILFLKKVPTTLEILSGKYSDNVLSIGQQKWIVTSTSTESVPVLIAAKSILFLIGLMLLSLLFYFYSRFVKEKIDFNSELLDRTKKEVESATSELRRQQEFLQNIIDRVPSIVTYWDRNLKNRLHNKSSLAFFGRSKESVPGTDMREYISPEIIELYMSNVRKTLNGESVTFERTVSDSEGKQRNLILHFEPDVEKNYVRGIIVVGSDITEIRELQEKEKEHLAALYSSSKLSLLGEMAAGVAHEINNPLAVIKLKINLVLRTFKEHHSDSSKFNEIIRNLEAADSTVNRAAKITAGLLSISRNSEDEAHQITSITDLISDISVVTSEKTSKELIDLQVHNEAPDINLQCNRVQIVQVILNLISNAAHAIEGLKEKWIKLRFQREGGFILIRVCDSGEGIAAETVEKMMNPFFTTKEVGRGTGLGLSISKKIIEAHRGTLSYEYFEGHTSLLVRIPISDSAI